MGVKVKIQTDRIPEHCLHALKVDLGWTLVERGITWTPHALEKSTAAGIKDAAIFNALRGEVVEFQRVKGQRRLLLRSADGTCVVVDIDRGTLITVWWNHPRDNHATLDPHQYYQGEVVSSLFE